MNLKLMELTEWLAVNLLYLADSVRRTFRVSPDISQTFLYREQDSLKLGWSSCSTENGPSNLFRLKCNILFYNSLSK